MKAVKIIFGVSTGLVVLGMLATFYNYFFNPALKIAFGHLGFPGWFREELGIAKLLGACALAVPPVPPRIKEWAYAGFAFSFSSAILAHYTVNDPAFNLLAPFVMLIILVISYITYHKINRAKTASM